MPMVNIDDKGCRGCTLCVEVCPVEVFELDGQIAKVSVAEDCIGCLSCFYICPSQCIEVSDIEILPPFHRMERNVDLVEKFLQTGTSTAALTEEATSDALRDVGVRLEALAQSVTETMGRGIRVVGRKAGALAADHLPEIYEETEIEPLLGRLQQRFKHSFDFDYEITDEEILLTFKPCGLAKVVEDAGGKLGEAVLCGMFHEYWAGLVGTFSKTTFQCEVPEVGATCLMKLTKRK
jgi:NAD-dependent dihydropyrimidine dehydrogenase PreA subunit